jgi:ankyrin repeat protein
VRNQCSEGKQDLDIRNENGETILHAACFVGNLQVVKALMDHGADPNATDHDGFTPLHTLMEGLGGSENTEEVLSFMLSKSANLHKKNLSGKTILHIACEKGETGWAEKILDQGADVNVRDNEGNSPLHLISDQNPQAMVELLLQHGADVGARNNATDTPLHSMCRHREADAAAAAAAAAACDAARSLLAAKGVDVDAHTSERRTPLHLAAELGSLEMLKLLAVEGKADVAARDHEGRHAWRVLGSHDNSDSNNDWYARGEALLEAGMDPNVWVDGVGSAPYDALMRGQDDLVHLLLRKGAVSDSDDLELVCSRGNVEMAKLLLGYGVTVTDKAFERVDEDREDKTAEAKEQLTRLLEKYRRVE